MSKNDLERVESSLGGASPFLARFYQKPPCWSLLIIMASDWIEIAQYLSVTGLGIMTS